MTILKRFASVVHLSIKNGIPMQKVCVPIQISPQIFYNVMLLVARIISMSLHNCIIQINVSRNKIHGLILYFSVHAMYCMCSKELLHPENRGKYKVKLQQPPHLHPPSVCVYITEGKSEFQFEQSNLYKICFILLYMCFIYIVRICLIYSNKYNHSL